MEGESPEDAARRREAEAAESARRDVTFREYALAWLDRVQHEPGKGGRTRRPGAVMVYRGRVRNHLLGPLGDLRVRGSAVVQAVSTQLASQPSVLKPGADHAGIAGDAVDLLKMILHSAMRGGLLETMPDVPTPSRRSVRHDADHTSEDDVATPQQVDALYAAAPPHWRIAVLLAAWCQLRRGEVLGLQRRDVVWNLDRTAATLYVRRQKNGLTGQLSDPKPEKGAAVSFSCPERLVSSPGRVPRGPGGSRQREEHTLNRRTARHRAGPACPMHRAVAGSPSLH
ncbi:hypothetical protein [Cellulosimicrobium cellulans]|uniref:hypothetical protein n=1 Tax=Cellulosimicrobium cellulans TaxID=1710 RepID=UPI000686F324|nr:hypothetical protein [Cellulosimicrobium cellulans]